MSDAVADVCDAPASAMTAQVSDAADDLDEVHTSVPRAASALKPIAVKKRFGIHAQSARQREKSLAGERTNRHHDVVDENDRQREAETKTRTRRSSRNWRSPKGIAIKMKTKHANGRASFS